MVILIKHGSFQVRGSREAMTIQDWAAQRCTISYRAPELFNVESHCIIDERTDIWVKSCIPHPLTLVYFVYVALSNEITKSLKSSDQSLTYCFFSCLLMSSHTPLVTWLCALLHDDVGRAIWHGISEGGQCCPGSPESSGNPTVLQVSLHTVTLSYSVIWGSFHLSHATFSKHVSVASFKNI